MRIDFERIVKSPEGVLFFKKPCRYGIVHAIGSLATADGPTTVLDRSVQIPRFARNDKEILFPDAIVDA